MLESGVESPSRDLRSFLIVDPELPDFLDVSPMDSVLSSAEALAIL